MFFSSKPTGVKCVCGGGIVMLFGSEHISESGPPIFGPGSKEQYRSVEYCYCGVCGIVYEPSVIRKKMPPEEKKNEESFKEGIRKKIKEVLQKA